MRSGRKNEKTHSFPIFFGAFSLLLRAAESPSKTPTPQDEVRWEYAFFRHAGDQAAIVWLDGSVQRVIPFGGRRRPEKADERMWYITGGINRMAAKIVWMDEDDVLMRRRVQAKPEEAPAEKK